MLTGIQGKAWWKNKRVPPGTGIEIGMAKVTDSAWLIDRVSIVQIFVRDALHLHALSAELGGA